MNKNNSKTAEVTESDSLRFGRAFLVLLIGGLIGLFVYNNTFTNEARFPFKLGLDLAGGSHLVYEADVDGIEPQQVPALMNVLRDVIERRINVFGVSEPVVYVERGSFVADVSRERLVVELPGVTDVEEAVREIGRTPLLEFKLVDAEALAERDSLELVIDEDEEDVADGDVATTTQVLPEPYLDTGLTGRYLRSAALEFASGQGSQRANEPIVSIVFDREGAELFASITRQNVGGNLAIFLDGELLSAPRINEPITGGRAIISGGFTPEEARSLAQNLNFGALPVPISLVSTQTIGATLGAEMLDQGIQAAIVGLVLIAIFMMAWYRLPGLVAVVALSIYIVLMLALFKVIPVTLTAAGLAGFVISLGMAVDANVLVFERFKEEYRSGKRSRQAAREGFVRAWSAIRDGNITSLLSAIILFWFGTSLVKGFALVFGIGIIVSMMSALLVTRTLLLALPEYSRGDSSFWSALYESGWGLGKK